MYKEVTGQFNRYMGHVAKNVGGVMTTPKTVEENGVVYDFVSKVKQKVAIAFLHDLLITTPLWLLDK